MEYYEKCFAYKTEDDIPACKALDDLYCIKEQCKTCAFFQTKEERANKMKIVRQRLKQIRDKALTKSEEEETENTYTEE